MKHYFPLYTRAIQLHPIFHITPADIQALDDEQARELIARLCRADVRSAGMAESSVAWGGDQRATDGGVDVRVDAKPARDIEAPLGRSVAVVQVKAEPFAPAKITPEMAPKGTIRPAIVDLAENDGLYLIASTRDHLSDLSLQARLEAMRACVAAHGLAGKVRVDFFDARRIADWVEQYPPVAVWLHQVIGKPLQGWQGYGPWAYQETDIGAQYILDEQVKVFAPDVDDGATAKDAINALRRDLRANKSVRLIGLSGVGKTRLAQALFDERIETDTPALPINQVIYTDISDKPDPQVEAMVQALVADNTESIVVIDNCGQETHSKLVDYLKRGEGRIALLTIEYDIRDDIPESTKCFRLEGSSPETVHQLLRARFPILSLHDADVVVQASEGNARLAFALASTAEHTDDLSSLRDGELFRRLFKQEKPDDDALLRTAKAASLIYSFDGEDATATSEMHILTSLAETTIPAFVRNIAELKRRGLLQSRGKMRAVLPHAVANRLASECFQEHLAPELEKALLDNAPVRVKSSLANRLSYLHASKEVQELVKGWLSPGGRFSDIASLDETDFQIFERIAVVDPAASLAAIERYLAAGLVIKKYDPRSQILSRLCLSVAYDPELFERSVEALLILDRMKDQSRSAQQPHEHLKPLFHIHLSGTHASLDQRAGMVRRLLGSTSDMDRQIGCDLLDAALVSGSFTGSHSLSFGSRRRDYGWYPKTQSDVVAWYAEFITIAGMFGQGDSELAIQVKTILGKHVRGLILRAGVMDELSRVVPSLSAHDGWPQAWNAVKAMLRWKELPDKKRSEVIAFEQSIRAKDLREIVIARLHSNEVLDTEGFDVDQFDSRLEASRMEAQQLGTKLAAEPELLFGLLPSLLTRQRGNAAEIGVGVGSSFSDPGRLISEIRRVVAEMDDSKLSLLFLRGVLSGWGAVDAKGVSAFLDEALTDPVFGKSLPELQFAVDLDREGFERLKACLKLGLAPVWHYSALGGGAVLEPFSVSEVASLLDLLASQDAKGQKAAIDVLHMVVYGIEKRDTAKRSEIGRYCIDFMTRMDWPLLDDDGERLEYELDAIVECATRSAQTFSDLQSMFDRIIAYRKEHPRYYPGTNGNYLLPVLSRFPSDALTYLYSGDDSDGHAASAALISRESRVDETGKEREFLQDDDLLKWVSVSPADRALFAAKICRLTEAKPADQVGEAWEPAKMISRLMDMAMDKANFLRSLTTRFDGTGSSERAIPHLELGLKVIKQLDTGSDPAVIAVRDEAVAYIGRRLSWWNQMMNSEHRGRAESFE